MFLLGTDIFSDKNRFQLKRHHVRLHFSSFSGEILAFICVHLKELQLMRFSLLKLGHVN